MGLGRPRSSNAGQVSMFFIYFRTFSELPLCNGTRSGCGFHSEVAETLCLGGRITDPGYNKPLVTF